MNLAEMSESLEHLVDMHGLARILSTLSVIAAGKADHIRDNWQDNVTAKSWDRTARKIEALATVTASEGV